MFVLSFKKVIPFVATLLAVSTLTPSSRAGVLNALYWAEGSTNSAGAYSYEAPMANQDGNSIFGFIPTDATQSSPDNDVVNYFRTVADLPGALPAYNGILLGDLSGYIGVTATFKITNSVRPAGVAFNGSDIVGETYPSQPANNAGIRLAFMGGTYDDPLYGVTPNSWWSTSNVAYVTSMKNGEDVVLTALFDPSLWSNYYGHNGTESGDTLAQFQAALSGVTRLGLSFGSGYFLSDGFAFNTGGEARIEVSDFSAVSGAAPEPAALVVLPAGLGALMLLKRRSRNSR